MKPFIKKTILFSSLGASMWIGSGFVDSYFEISKNLDVFASLFKELNIYYVDPTDPNKLMKKGIDAMLESLDPYNDYYPESELEDYKIMTTGQYGGIGAQVRKKNEFVVIAEPYEGYAAQKAGLMAGDVIIEIDGKTARNKNTEEISKALKGSPNTKVKLVISRPGEAKNIELEVERSEVHIKNVPYYGMLNENTGYIKLAGFTENASGEVKNAFNELKKNPNFKSLVFDLRDNPGGLLNEAVNISNLFIDKGQDIVSTRGKMKDWDKLYKAINPSLDTQIPLVVLVNSGSASASEIVSGSLQDLDRAVIMGQRTFGKGLVQSTRPLTYNATIKITTAKYYIPSGRCIQAIDYTHRNNDGSVGKIPDSLITAFKTKNGRKVYDGGGIMPDVKTSNEKYSDLSISLLSKQLIFDYATNFKIQHKSIDSKTFEINDAEYKNFLAFLKDKDYQYETNTEVALDELKKEAEDDLILTQVNAEIEALKEKLKSTKKEDLQIFQSQIKQLLKEEIVSRYAFQTGRIEAHLKADTEVQKALDLLKEPSQVADILSGKVNPNNTKN